MVSLIDVLWFFLPLCGLVLGTSPGGVLLPFEIDSLLTCHVVTKRDGIESIVPEETQRIPFGVPVRQEGHPDRIFLPDPSGYRLPPGSPDKISLTDFLGADFNRRLTSITLPTFDPPRGCEELAATEGSGGQELIHISEDMDSIPFLDDPIQNVVSIRQDTSADRTQLSVVGVQNTRTVLIDEINNVPELCDIHTALCPLNTTWAELPYGYFPKFLAQGTCSNKNCSFPRGKTCTEDFKYIAFVTVLRWDCCFDSFMRQQQFVCGWRKVNVPLVCDCTCSCT